MIDKMFSLGDGLRTTAVTIDDITAVNKKLQRDEVTNIVSYSPDYLIIQAKTNAVRLLVLTDIYYPSWKAFIDGKQVDIVQVDFAFRGVLIPKGMHKLEFKDSLL